MSGLSDQWRDLLEEGIYLGSRAPWLLPQGGACGMMHAQPNAVTKEAMESKKQDTVSLGARLIERDSAVKTATQADNDSTAEHSVLSLVVSNVSEAYSQCLTRMAEFVNATGKILYKLNQDFTQISLDPTMLSALFNAVQGGKLPAADFWQYLRDRGVIDPEKTDGQIRDELETENPGPDLDDDDTVIPDGGKPSDP
jgi:hypothetical protein